MTSPTAESSTNGDVPADAEGAGGDVSADGGDASADGGDASAYDDVPEGMTAGRRVVFAIYLASIGVAALFGGVLGVVLQRQDGPSMGAFGPITFELTPVTLAIFGMVMVGVLLTVGLLLVQYVSARFS